MSGSEFERENIVAETLSATAASKPADSPREHTWRPPGEGLYDLSMQ
jgi:glutamate synthase (NADPH/NADH) large chain